MGQKVRLSWDKRGKDQAAYVDGLHSGPGAGSSREKRFRRIKFHQLTPGNVITQR